MNYDIKLYAHGVPKGQSAWGVGTLENNYIDSFYGRKSNVPVQMLAEVKQFGSSTNCYYTYLRTENVCDSDGRSGSYVALTLCINYYYADIRNIYNLLDAAYNKFIIGSVVGVSGNTTKYLISDFQQANAVLKSLEQEIKNYLMQFSSDSDFISLNGFKANGQNEPSIVNILECDTNTIANHVKKNSSISVSAFHQSLREQQIIQKKNAEVNAANSQAQQQINAAQQNAQRDINAARSQAKQEITAAQRDKEASIQAIRNEYKDADKTISQLRSQNDKANKEISRLSSQVNDLNVKYQNAQAYKAKYEASQGRLEKAEELINEIKKNLSGLRRLFELLGISSVGTKVDGGYSDEDRKDNNSRVMSCIEKMHPLIDIFVMVILLGIIGFTLPKSCGNSGKPLSSNNDKQKIEQQTSIEPQDKTDNGKDAGATDDVQNFQMTLQSLKDLCPDAKIDVSGINEGQNSFMRVDRKYMFSVKGAANDLNGEWVCNPAESEICAGSITSKISGDSLTISYKVVAVFRTFKVVYP